MSNPQSSGQVNTGQYEPGVPSQLLASAVGVDLRLIPEYAGTRVEYERMKVISIAIAMAVPAFMGFFAVYLFVAPLVSHEPTRVGVAFVVSLIIFVLDCLIVRTISTGGHLALLVRVFMGIAMASTNAEPVVNRVFAETIQAKMQDQADDARDKRETVLKERLAANEQEATRVNDAMASAGTELRAYSPEDIATRRLRDLAARKSELKGTARAHNLEEVTALDAAKVPLLKQYADLKLQIEAEYVKLQDELRGVRDTKQAGRGNVSRLLNDNIAALKAEQQRISDRLLALNQRIESASKDRSEEVHVDAEFDALVSSAQQNQLTAAEQSEKLRLETEIARHAATLKALEERHKQISDELSQLPQKYAVANRDDVLAQSLALWAVLQENDVVRWKAFLLFSLLFLADMLPILVKITAGKNYDAYVKTCEQGRAAIEAARRERAYDEMKRLETASIKGLCDTYRTCSQLLQDTKPGPAQTQHEKAMWQEMAMEMRDFIADQVAKTREARVGERRQQNPLSAARSGLRAFFWYLKSKLVGASQ